jgi:hypothetical protein
MGRRRVDLQEAAEILGISSDAVRKRAKRGTLDHETGADGKLYVWVDDGETDGRTPPDEDRDRLIEFLRSELAAWQEEARRKDHIIAALTQRIPELEPAPDPREASETASGGPAKGDVPEEERQPWWRRLFGG